ncbi:MAG: UDP-3-O-acyl-N-acetylglucosamine deacetylase [Gammaproteobacteria bacterium]
MIKQRTLKQSVQTAGIGIHSGEMIQLNLQSAPENTGIVFRRIDQTPVVAIPALTTHIGDTRLNSCLSHNGVSIATVEHLLSAFAGLGIDNAYIDLAAGEVPVMDGSAEHFANLIQTAGVVEQFEAKKFLRIKKPIIVEMEDKWAKLEPHEGFRFSVSIDYVHPLIRRSTQDLTLEFTQASFIQEISRARTFGFLADYENLKKHRLALGASLENTVVLGDEKVLNQEGLRYPDEFVRHKMLDAIGDLYLLGHSVIGAFSSYKPGHHLNHQLRCALLADRDAWEIVTLDKMANLPVSFVEPGLAAA